MLKPAVSSHLAKLKKICDGDFTDETAFGPKGALKGLPELIQECFEIEPDKRPPASKLVAVLQKMCERAEYAPEPFEVERNTTPIRQSFDDRTNSPQNLREAVAGLGEHLH